MSDQVTLTATTEEIRKLIQGEQHDAAIALCQHVLHYFPKYVETYRQMAEATLEKGDLEGARELFGRVLSADPENIVAYAGLALVLEQQHLVDEAYWHLERAHELAPANLEIRKELTRLSAEIEGKPRTRLKITPGGLARLYEAEGLFAQAAQEFRTIAGNQPKRFDARVGLAEVLWRSGRLSQAADAAQSLLRVLPFCLKANLILGAALQQSGLEESETHLQLAEALDPTNRSAQDLFGVQSPLHPNDPVLPRYEEEARPLPAPGLTFATEEEGEQLFPSATAVETPSSTEAPDESTVSQPAEQAPAPVLEEQTELPDWLVRESPAGTATPTEAALLNEEQSAEQLAEETLPFAPSPLLPEQSPGGQAPAAESTPFEENPLAGELPPIETPTPEGLPPAAGVPFGVDAAEAAELPFVESLPFAADQALEQGAPTAAEELPSWLTPKETAQEQEPAAESRTAEATTPSQQPAWLDEAPLPPFSEVKRSVSVEEESKPVEPVPEAPTPSNEMETRQEPAAPSTTETPGSELPAWVRADFRGTERPPQSAPRVPPKPTTAVPSSLPPWLTDRQRAHSGKTPDPEQETHSEPGEESQTTAKVEQVTPFDVARPEAQGPLSETPSGLIEIPSADAQPGAEPGPLPDESAGPVPPDLTGPEKMRPPNLRRRQVVQANARLELARAYTSANQLGLALDEYEQIVAQAPLLVSQIIPDLEKLVAMPGVPLKAHRVLGDAYTRVDRLGDALSQYRFLLDRVS